MPQAKALMQAPSDQLHDNAASESDGRLRRITH